MRRKLSSVESLLWFGGRRLSTFALTATVRGRITAERLGCALDKARFRHPLLSVRVELDGDSTLYVTSEGVGQFPVQVAERADETSVYSHILPALQTPFPWQTGPLVRFVLVQGRETSDLIVACHHAFSDGWSVVYLLRDMLTFMAEPNRPVDALPELPAHDDLIPDTVALAPEPPDGIKGEVLENETADEPESVFVHCWKLPEARTRALLDRCHDKGIRAHSIICAAVLKAFADVQEQSLRTVASSVSLRNRTRIPAGEAFGLFIHPGIHAQVECSPGRDLWEIAQDIQTKTQAQMTDHNLFGPMVGLSQVFGSMPYSQALQVILGDQSVQYDVAVTNLGRLEIPTAYGDLSLEALVGPLVLALKGETILGVNTLNSQMRFAWVGRSRTLDPQIASTIQHQATRYLEQAAESPVM